MNHCWGNRGEREMKGEGGGRRGWGGGKVGGGGEVGGRGGERGERYTEENHGTLFTDRVSLCYSTVECTGDFSVKPKRPRRKPAAGSAGPIAATPLIDYDGDAKQIVTGDINDFFSHAQGVVGVSSPAKREKKVLAFPVPTDPLFSVWSRKTSQHKLVASPERRRSYQLVGGAEPSSQTRGAAGASVNCVVSLPLNDPPVEAEKAKGAFSASTGGSFKGAGAHGGGAHRRASDGSDPLTRGAARAVAPPRRGAAGVTATVAPGPATATPRPRTAPQQWLAREQRIQDRARKQISDRGGRARVGDYYGAPPLPGSSSSTTPGVVGNHGCYLQNVLDV